MGATMPVPSYVLLPMPTRLPSSIRAARKRCVRLFVGQTMKAMQAREPPQVVNEERKRRLSKRVAGSFLFDANLSWQPLSCYHRLEWADWGGSSWILSVNDGCALRASCGCIRTGDKGAGADTSSAMKVAIEMPDLAFDATPADAETYDKYFYFHRDGTDFDTAFNDFLMECDALASGSLLWWGRPCDGQLLCRAIWFGGRRRRSHRSAIADAIFGLAER